MAAAEWREGLEARTKFWFGESLSLVKQSYLVVIGCGIDG